MYATKTISSQTTSGWIPMDDNQAAFNASIAVAVSGTLTYSVEFTLDNVQDPAITPTVFSTTLVGATASQSLAVHYPVKAFRLNVTAFTIGSATITVLQGSSWDGVSTVGNSLEAELAAIYRPAPFPDFAPRLLASLVASSTAACTSGVVTVTATSHGLPATIFDGHEIYYPGSPTLAAGWYGGFVRTDANTLTFSAPSSADFGSESVNAGAAVTAEVTAYSMTLPVGSLPAGNIVSARMQRSADAVASAHTIIMKIGSDTIGRYASSAASPTGTFSLSAAIVSSTRICGASTLEGGVSSSVYNVTFDPSVENTLSITLTLGAAGMYQRIGACKVSIS